MITHVSTLCIFVSDQDRAKAFYTDKLGMALKSDQPLYPGATARWLSVAPPGAQTEIILYLPDEHWEHYKQTVGKSQALTLGVSDLAGTYEALTANGVTFAEAPKTEFWGTFATLEDSEGNRLLLVEEPAEG